MSFLAIIIALVLVQIWGSGGPVQRDGWLHDWQARVAAWGVPSGLKLVLLLLPPLLLCALVLDAVEPILFGLVWIAVAVFVLLYAFGRGDFHTLMAQYRDRCRSGDFEGALLAAGDEFGWDAAAEEPASPEEVHRLIQRGLIYEGFQRWFAVLFYFVVLGPVGALAYRLLQLSRQNFEPELTRRCLFLADWVPARLLAAAFTLTGDFVGSRDELLDALQQTSQDAGHLLHGVAIAAVGIELDVPIGEDGSFGELASAQNLEFAGLLSRSAVCWVALISLLVVLS